MKKFFISCLLSGLMLGCSSSQQSTSVSLENYSGGERMGDATSLYWYTEESNHPYAADDYIQSRHDGWYQTSYRWENSVLKELIREGEQISVTAGKQELVPFRVHVRFDKNGDAVYQQYRVNHKVFPLTAEALGHYKSQAEAIVDTVKKQDKQDQTLIQGVWDGETFETCSGQEYEKVEFNKTLPGFVIQRLSSLDNYMAFLGNIRNGRVYIQELLMLADDGHECITRPNLLEKS
ncbi:DUF1481 domain-containing protein [Vibrio ruber]|uniref:DUF1481 domain-containing protein n=1 Tax=Vibrio ruber TaxID=184755 RepID=UPI002892A653|nr:DUF1481 domain-containing protein [Vibrio ruber]WNJ96458.1 DUF1481 domain-containing protein [Vibrio ruber]